MITRTLVILGSLLAIAVALSIGVVLLQGDVERLGRETAGMHVLTTDTQTESGSVLRETLTQAVEADERIRSSFIDVNNVSATLEDIERIGRAGGVSATIRSVNKSDMGVTVAITLEGSQTNIIASLKQFQTLPAFELTSIYLTFSNNAQKSGWEAATTLLFPTP